MKKVKSIVFSVLFGVSYVSAQSIDFAIMSFNIQQPYGNNWDERKDSAVAIIRNENVDVIGTQEAINSQRKYLSDSTMGYLWYGRGRDGGDSGEGSWIFYKTEKFTLDSAHSGDFWLSDTPDIPSRFGGDYNRICTYVRLIDNATGKGIYFFNAHFPTPDLYNARLKSIKLLMQYAAERAKKYEPIYIMGDFNSSENDGVTKWMKNGSDNPLQCRDTYRDVYPTGNVTTGFGSKYDYIYCPNQSNYVTHDSWVIKQPSKASDHMPIAASVSIYYLDGQNILPTADAGPDQLITLAVDASDEATVVLDASESFNKDGMIDKYEWKAADTLLAEGESVQITLPIGGHPIYLYVTDTNGAVSEDQVLIVIEREQEEVSVVGEKTSTNRMELYPVPVSDLLYISSSIGNVEELKLYNSQGKMIASTEGQNQINMSSYTSGLYLIEVKVNDNTYIHKVVKN